MESSLYRSRSNCYTGTPLRRTAEHLELQEEAIGKESFLLLQDKLHDVSELRTELQRRDLELNDLRSQIMQLSGHRDGEVSARRELAGAREASRVAEAQAAVSRRNYEAAMRERNELEARLAQASNRSSEELRRTVLDLDAARRRVSELEDGIATRDGLVRQLQRDVDALLQGRRAAEAQRDRTEQERGAELAQTRELLEQTEARLNDALARAGALEMAVRDQESDASAARNRIHDLESRLARAESDAAEQRSSATRLATERNAAETALRDRDAALVRAGEVRTAMEEQARELSRRLDQSVPKSELAGALRSRDEAARAATQAREDLASLRVERQRIADDNSRLAGAVDARAREIEALQTTLAQREREVSASTRRCVDVTDQLSSVARERDDASRRVDALTSDLARSTRIILDTETRLRSAEERADTHRREASDAIVERQRVAERRLGLARERAVVEDELSNRLSSAVAAASPARSTSRPSYAAPSPLAVSRGAADLNATDLRDVICDLDRSLAASGVRIPTSPAPPVSSERLNDTRERPEEDLTASRLSLLRSYA